MSKRPPPTDKKPKANNTLPRRSPQNPSQNRGSSSRNPTRTRMEEEERRIFERQLATTKDTCVICLEEYQDHYLAKLSCNHRVCSECLTDMFRSSTIDESRYPPKCCHRIPLETVRSFLNKKVIEEFEQKMVEWETQNRTYCSDTECGAFIHENHIVGSLAHCPRCVRITCTKCKTVAHARRPCPEDETTKQALDLMEKEGYKRCSQCQSGVELMAGCNHLTCVCGHQFCYICGEIWKTCPCPAYGHPRRSHIDMNGTYHPAPGQVAQAGNLPVPPGPQGVRLWGDVRREAGQGWREAQQQQGLAGQRDIPAVNANVNLFAERRAPQQQPALQPPIQRPGPAHPQRTVEQALQHPRVWPQPQPENWDMRDMRAALPPRPPPQQQMGNPVNQAPLAFYGGYPPSGQPWLHYGQPGPARQPDFPNPQRPRCNTRFGYCSCGQFHDPRNPGNPGR